MKKTVPFVFLILSCFSALAQFGIYATAAFIKTNNTTAFYNGLAPGNEQNIGNLALQGRDLGSFYQNDGSLVLVGAEIKTYKSVNDNVCSGTLQFTVYPKNQRPANPVFTAIGLGFYANCTDPVCGNFPNAFPQANGGGCCNPGDQKWQNPGGGNGGGNDGNIDLTTRAAGDYTLEIYFQISGADNGSGCNTIKYDGNNSNPTNYTASFSLLPSLPVLFGNITAVQSSAGNQISWTTLTEQNSSRFIVERSPDGMKYEAIGSVAAAGQSTLKKQYVFTDQQPLKGSNFYRVQMQETGGERNYSAIVLLNRNMAPGKALLYPSPAKNIVHFYVPEQSPAVRIFNANGHMVHAVNLSGQFYDLSVASWPAGNYYAQISGQSGQSLLRFVVLK